jgi:protein-L-isoaspartate(D-aspartate) O-methyltransferase
MMDESVADVGANWQKGSSQARMAFLLALRARGLADVAVLRALEIAPREMFVPRRHADLALRDVALPISCGQTMPEPYLVGRMMEALDVQASHCTLEIGAGSGYATAILAQLSGIVLSYERFRSLALEAQTRLEALGLTNARVEWDDGLEAGPAAGPFDRILVHGLLEDTQSLDAALLDGGLMVFGRLGADGQRVLVRRARSGQDFIDTDIVRCRLGPLTRSKSACL